MVVPKVIYHFRKDWHKQDWYFFWTRPEQSSCLPRNSRLLDTMNQTLRVQSKVGFMQLGFKLGDHPSPSKWDAVLIIRFEVVYTRFFFFLPSPAMCSTRLNCSEWLQTYWHLTTWTRINLSWKWLELNNPHNWMQIFASSHKHSKAIGDNFLQWLYEKRMNRNEVCLWICNALRPSGTLWWCWTFIHNWSPIDPALLLEPTRREPSCLFSNLILSFNIRLEGWKCCYQHVLLPQTPDS